MNDKLILLLSTHWFLPNWDVLALYVGEKAKWRVRIICEDLVCRFAPEGSVYWNVDLSVRRRQETRRQFIEKISNVPDGERVIEWASQIIGGDEDANIKSLFAMVAQYHGQDYIKAIAGKEISEWAERWWALVNAAPLEFERQCLESSATWDAKVRALTPDLPTYTADFAGEVLTSQMIFPAYWKRLSTILAEDQQDKLLEMYSQTAEKMTGSGWPPPKWMKERPYAKPT